MKDAKPRYPQFSAPDYPAFEAEINQFWKENDIFDQSVTTRPADKPFTFYEGPPSANGRPGIHHVLSRTLKDLFCRYKTLQGFQVKRKAGWDTHGLPIELQVEKKLGITKKDIGVSISVEEYNRLCRESVMEFKDVWDDLTEKMGHWLDLENPYITYDNNYIESCWNLLKRLYDKGLLYKGYTIQPYSPAAGTGLSSHELNIPGCYKDVKDTSAVACFQWIDAAGAPALADGLPSYFLAWTTTPWTLASNTALAVGANIDYADVETLNPYTFQRARYVLAKAAISRYFTSEGENADFDAYLALSEEQRRKAPLPWRFHCACKGSELAGERYAQLLPFANVTNGAAFKVIVGDFVTTEDGTGIVHLAPTFGADDKRAAEAAGMGSVVFPDGQGGKTPMVDRQGKYLETFPEDLQGKDYAVYLEKFAGRYVKDYTDDPNYKNIDVDLSIYLKEQNLAFKVEKYEHNYPHCWRTDKPVLYYPLESWFIKTSAARDRMVEINKTINWKPASTGTGRFENWLENLVDWNLSRSRYWGTPLPIWETQTDTFTNSTNIQRICIGSLDEFDQEQTFLITDKFNVKNYQRVINLINDLKISDSELPVFENLSPRKLLNFLGNLFKKVNELRSDSSLDSFIKNDQEKIAYELDRSSQVERFLPTFIKEGLLIPFSELPKENLDLHKPFIDNIVIYKDSYFYTREPDLIDVWFDSGAMPFAQWHYPFENKDIFAKTFPADFIAEGVDQTRGWFFTLHAIAVMLEDKPAYKNVIANGLVLDKEGRKMSKRLGNGVDPFEIIGKYGADSTRWYMMENTSPWDNLKFNEDYLAETQRRFFGTLFNTYNFFALYANIDGFVIDEKNLVPVAQRPELDRWVLSKLHSLIVEVETAFDDYDPTRAARAVQYFVNEELSNWYVRLNRRRFWKGDMTDNKKAAYQTLHEVLLTVAQLMSPIAPFFSDWLYKNLTDCCREQALETGGALPPASVHLSFWPAVNPEVVNPQLERNMAFVQEICSLVHSIRKKTKIKVRVPLQKVLVPVLDHEFEERYAAITQLRSIIESEVNVKDVDIIFEGGSKNILVTKVKPVFKNLGKKLGPKIKQVGELIANLTPEQIGQLKQKQNAAVTFDDGATFEIEPDDIEIVVEDLPGWSVASNNNVTVALDITLTEELLQEGLARELVNRLQNLRKDLGFDVTDRISVQIAAPETWAAAFRKHESYICSEILAEKFEIVSSLSESNGTVEIEGESCGVLIMR